ncbi:phospholipase D family protein [Roseomonas sp. E05]|uniref:phospholipase D family protein n=1 Tax=Roseomonas sp. E05 TaxID=3046310 RepID=UPI0024BA353B|nr:phospholipase D family protein [Roseomonas sp. E05]MDJ0391638.1 phospholipase D family protein [Roseomonas sp. E05]
MKRIFSNGPDKDFVINPFKRLMAKSSRLHLAAPFFSLADPVVEAARAGKRVELLVGLNSATSPEALRKVYGIAGVAVRYLTHRFHAKIYVFDEAALVGSSNLTDGGLQSNREATICLDQPEDLEAIQEVRALFAELWDAAHVLTDEKLRTFELIYAEVRRAGPDPDTVIERAVGRAEPTNINVASRTRSRERLFLEDLRRQVYEQYRPAFDEVTHLLAPNGFRRPELEDVGLANETNRFLNWVRLTYVSGDEAWRSAPVRPPEERRNEILRLGQEWTSAANSRVPPDYAAWLRRVRDLFGNAAALQAASKNDITEGLMSIHAFLQQSRFVKGGQSNLPVAFWAANGQDVAKVRRTLSHLVHGPGDFIQRLHDVLYDRGMKLGYFGHFCALELYGSVRPDECPPMNGRMAKALRYLGFQVWAA